MSQLRAFSGTVLAAVLLLASTVALPAAPAHAAVCSGSSGVTVVVDFNEVGGGLQTACDADGGGKKASTIFADSGFPLAYATRQPGFVCKVSGAPSNAPCVNASPENAFWSLWVSSGSGWSFATLGATSLTVPDGGMVAFSWENTESGDSPPDISGSRAAPSPSPTQSPGGQSGSNTGGGGNGDSGGAGPGSSGSPSPGASAAPTDAPGAEDDASDKKKRKAVDRKDRDARTDGKKKRDKATPSASASPDAEAETPSEEETAPTAAEPPADSGGLPGWVAPGLIGILFAVAGGVMALRRRSSTP